MEWVPRLSRVSVAKLRRALRATPPTPESLRQEPASSATGGRGLRGRGFGYARGLRLGVARVLVLRGSRVLVQLRLDLGERGPGRDLLLDGLVRVRARVRVRVRVRARVRVGVKVMARVSSLMAW